MISENGILLIISAIGIVIVNAINAWRTNSKIGVVEKKTDDQNKVIDKIHDSTNSGFDKVNQANQDLERKLESVVTNRLAELEREKALAQAKITNLEAEIVKRADAAVPPNGKVSNPINS